jgi:hypothetical protein
VRFPRTQIANVTRRARGPRPGVGSATPSITPPLGRTPPPPRTTPNPGRIRTLNHYPSNRLTTHEKHRSGFQKSLAGFCPVQMKDTVYPGWLIYHRPLSNLPRATTPSRKSHVRRSDRRRSFLYILFRLGTFPITKVFPMDAASDLGSVCFISGRFIARPIKENNTSCRQIRQPQEILPGATSPRG